ncbi:MAG: hypothetical protein COA65_08345, partial [Rhodospirillaceae bacterium]
MKRTALIWAGSLAIGLAAATTDALADNTPTFKAMLGQDRNLTTGKRPDGHAPISLMGEHRHD